LITAGLAGNVSQARGTQLGFEDSLQARSLADQEDARRQQAALEQQRMAMDAQLQGQRSGGSGTGQMVPSPAYTEGGGGTGPTLYQPQGALGMMPAAQAAQFASGTGGQADPGTGGQGAWGTGRSRYAHAPLDAQVQHGRVDDMQQNGYLNAAEAARWHGLIESGGNPFNQKTTAEEEAAAHLRSQISPWQQAQLDRQSRYEEERETRESYLAQKEAIKELIDDKRKRAEKLHDPDERDRLTKEIEQHEKDLRELAEGYVNRKKQPTSPSPLVPSSPRPPAPLARQDGLIQNPGGDVRRDPGAGQIFNTQGMRDYQDADAARNRAGTAGTGQDFGLSMDQALQLRQIYGSGAAARAALQKFGSYQAALQAAGEQG